MDGSKRMATSDDIALERRPTIYEEGFDGKTSSWSEHIGRSGDIHSPRVRNERGAWSACGSRPGGLHSELCRSPERGSSADVMSFARD